MFQGSVLFPALNQLHKVSFIASSAQIYHQTIAMNYENRLSKYKSIQSAMKRHLKIDRKRLKIFLTLYLV